MNERTFSRLQIKLERAGGTPDAVQDATGFMASEAGLELYGRTGQASTLLAAFITDGVVLVSLTAASDGELIEIHVAQSGESRRLRAKAVEWSPTNVMVAGADGSRESIELGPTTFVFGGSHAT